MSDKSEYNIDNVDDILKNIKPNDEIAMGVNNVTLNMLKHVIENIKDTTIDHYAEELDITTEELNNWLSGTHDFRLSELVMIAKSINCSVAIGIHPTSNHDDVVKDMLGI